MITTAVAETRTLVRNVRWETYVALCDDRRGSVPRMTYSRGELELMSPKKEHEKIKTLLGRMVIAYCEAHEIEIESVASTTFRRQDLDRGFEADESFYIEHAEELRAKEEIDLSIDPSPELVIEVEITSPLLAKLDLFAAMGVLEVWRHDGESLKLFRLSEAKYVAIDESVSLAGFPVPLAQTLLMKRHAQGEISILRQFREALG